MSGRRVGVEVEYGRVITDGRGINVRTRHAFAAPADLDVIMAGCARVRIGLRLKGRDVESLFHAILNATQFLVRESVGRPHSGPWFRTPRRSQYPGRARNATPRHVKGLGKYVVLNPVIASQLRCTKGERNRHHALRGVQCLQGRLSRLTIAGHHARGKTRIVTGRRGGQVSLPGPQSFAVLPCVSPPSIALTSFACNGICKRLAVKKTTT